MAHWNEIEGMAFEGEALGIRQLSGSQRKKYAQTPSTTSDFKRSYACSITSTVANFIKP
jgi:hypothetical protein